MSLMWGWSAVVWQVAALRREILLPCSRREELRAQGEVAAVAPIEPDRASPSNGSSGWRITRMIPPTHASTAVQDRGMPFRRETTDSSVARINLPQMKRGSEGPDCSRFQTRMSYIKPPPQPFAISRMECVPEALGSMCAMLARARNVWPGMSVPSGVAKAQHRHLRLPGLRQTIDDGPAPDWHPVTSREA